MSQYMILEHSVMTRMVGIVDKTDNILEYFSFNKLIEIVKSGIKIDGVNANLLKIKNQTYYVKRKDFDLVPRSATVFILKSLSIKASRYIASVSYTGYIRKNEEWTLINTSPDSIELRGVPMYLSSNCTFDVNNDYEGFYASTGLVKGGLTFPDSYNRHDMTAQTNCSSTEEFKNFFSYFIELSKNGILDAPVHSRGLCSTVNSRGRSRCH